LPGWSWTRASPRPHTTSTSLGFRILSWTTSGAEGLAPSSPRGDDVAVAAACGVFAPVVFDFDGSAAVGIRAAVASFLIDVVAGFPTAVSLAFLFGLVGFVFPFAFAVTALSCRCCFAFAVDIPVFVVSVGGGVPILGPGEGGLTSPVACFVMLNCDCGGGGGREAMVAEWLLDID